jgi:predicted nucleic acid-binding Zn ribbon protein
MSTTILRLGLWTLILVLATFVIREANLEQPWAELIPHQMLQQALGLSGVLIVIGVVLSVLGKGASAVARNRCRVCKRPIATGAIYCREHLRNVLQDEDERTHMTKIRRR